MVNLRYKAKDGRVFMLKESRHPKLIGKYRITFVDLYGYCQAWRKSGVENSWLPKDEAIANIKKVADMMGWQEEKAV